MNCPYCGGKNDDSAHFCQWCQAELMDNSDIQMHVKLKHIEQKTGELKKLPRLTAHTVCLVILIGAIVLGVGGTVFAIFKGFTFDSLLTYSQAQKTASLESKMKSAYDQDNYDKLYQLIVNESENTIYCNHYFSYREVLIAHEAHQDFERALEQLSNMNTAEGKNAAIAQMCLSYSKLIAEKSSHESLSTEASKAAMVQQMWSLLPELEEQLNQEIDFETENLEKWIDYPLDQLSNLTVSEIKALDFTSFLKE